MAINLNERGLSEWDTIDPYLDQYYNTGEHVTIDAGNYYLDDASSHFSATMRSADTIIEGEGPGEEAILHTNESSIDPYFYAGGSAHNIARHITFNEGAGSLDGGSIRVRAGSSATVTLENVNRPDGNDPNGSSRGAGIFVRPEHAGVANFVNCHIEGFFDNGLYGSAPGSSAESNPQNGEVNVLGGLYKNNNICNIRISTENSSIIGAACVQDEVTTPSWAPGPNHRNIWLRDQYGDNILVEDVDIYHSLGSYWVLVADNQANGEVNDCRVYTENSSVPAIGDVSDGPWSTSGCHVTGPGDHTNAMGSNECSGSTCDVATTEKRWYGSDEPDEVDPTDGEHWGWNPHNTDDSLRLGAIEMYDEHPFGDHRVSDSS
ncbi:hypothetical protein ACLI4Y_08670 [Natrialbaceae archaeon A-CW3]